MTTLQEQLLALPEATASSSTKDGIATALVPVGQWLSAAGALRDQLGCTRFIDVTCVDDPDAALRFELVLLTYSMEQKAWARLKTRTAGDAPSLVPIFAAAHMYEREIFDMFGVTFTGHPSLTRLLMPDAWKGHPLRRDEPLVQEPIDFTVTRDLYKT